MGLKDKSYAKVWSVKPNGKCYSGQISVSKKDKESGEYTTLFSGFVNFAGEAAKKAADLGLPETMDRSNPVSKNIQITSSPDISTWFNKKQYDELIALAKGNEKLISFIKGNVNSKTITIWDFEVCETYSSSKNQNNNKQPKTNKVVEDEEDLPF